MPLSEEAKSTAVRMCYNIHGLRQVTATAVCQKDNAALKHSKGRTFSSLVHCLVYFHTALLRQGLHVAQARLERTM